MSLRENIAIVFSIFRRDVLRLARNPISLIVVAGVCLMPSLYAWYTIAANWDPYKNTSAIEVAVANNDEGAQDDLAGRIDIGREVVAKLHDDHNLGWRFVDEDQAVDGVYSGSYYAAIVIPKDFSADFLSIFNGEFKQPELNYYVNEKISAVAPKITDAGAGAIEDQINSSFVDTVSEAAVGVMQKAGIKIEDDSDAANDSLLSGVSNAKDAISETCQALKMAEPTFESAEDSISGAQGVLATLEDAMPGIEGDLSDAEQTLRTVREDVGAYGSTMTESLTSAARSIGKAASDANIAMSQMRAKLTAAQGYIDSSLGDAQKILRLNQEIISALQAGAEDSGEDPMIERLEHSNESLEATIAALQALSGDVGGAMQAAGKAAGTISDEAARISGEAEDASSEISQKVLPSLEMSLDDFASALGLLQGACAALEPEIDRGRQTLEALSETISQAREATSFSTDSLLSIQKDLEDSLSDLQTLRGSQSVKGLSDYLGLSAEEVGSFISTPVELKTQTVYPVENYGSGVAPFYTNLALWVAGFILVAILHLGIDPKGLRRFTVTQAYFGRWLLFIMLGAIQGLIVCIGDLVLGIQCVNPVAFVAAGLVTVIVDVSIMYSLVFAMRHLGRAIGVIVLIMQIPGSSGEYPVEMMPPFFQAIHPLLPFTYSIDAMREAIGGFYDGHYLMDLTALLPFFVLAIAFGLVAGRYAFNLNVLFDRKLAKTDLFICEEPDTLRERFRLRAMLRALLDLDAFRKALSARIERFRRNYPRLVRFGWIAVGALAALTLALAFAVHADNEVKVVLLVCMVFGVFAVGVYLIVLEYLNASLDYELEISSMSATAMKRNVDSARYSYSEDVERDGSRARSFEGDGGTSCLADADGLHLVQGSDETDSTDDAAQNGGIEGERGGDA